MVLEFHVIQLKAQNFNEDYLDSLLLNSPNKKKGTRNDIIRFKVPPHP